MKRNKNREKLNNRHDGTVYVQGFDFKSDVPTIQLCEEAQIAICFTICI